MTIIVKKNYSSSLFKIIKEKLNNLELVGLPTETVYGLAGLGTKIESAKKIYKLKERPLHKKLIFHCSDMKMVKKFFFLDQENEILAKRFWPGPLTLILKRKSLQIPKSLTINNDCAVRIPKNDFTIEVIKKIGLPLIMPSANRFKKLSPINAKMVSDQFKDTNLLIIDGGKCKIGLESTLVRILKNKLEIIRPGKISLSQIKKVLPYINLFNNNKEKFFPGTSKKHYSPNKQIYLNIKHPVDKSAYLNFGKKHKKEFKNLSEKGSLNEAAKNLYHFIFLADQNKDFKTISIAPIPNRDIGEAINDRLKRAAR
ncbi:MAG: threonylcarbamoyl-AMP synthase [Pelagibacteraceae bacterium]|nr:MAG: threonylcarbamoyl-AMP synthase [Pelagibacteraceae bacterium]